MEVIYKDNVEHYNTSQMRRANTEYERVVKSPEYWGFSSDDPFSLCKDGSIVTLYIFCDRREEKGGYANTYYLAFTKQ